MNWQKFLLSPETGICIGLRYSSVRGEVQIGGFLRYETMMRGIVKEFFDHSRLHRRLTQRNKVVLSWSMSVSDWTAGYERLSENMPTNQVSALGRVLT